MSESAVPGTETPAPSAAGTVPATPGQETMAPGQPFQMGNLSPEHTLMIQNKGWGSLTDVLTGYQGAEQKIGSDPSLFIQKPSGPGDLAGIQAFGESIGAPGSPDAYDFSALETSAEEAGFGNLVPLFRNLAHGVRMNQDQANTFGQMWTEALEAGAKIDEAEFQTSKNEARSAFLLESGQRSDEFLSRIDRFYSKNPDFDRDQIERVLGPGVADRLALAVDRATGEPLMNQNPSVPGPPGGNTEVVQAQAKIDENYGNKEFMARLQANKNGPEQAEMNRLYETAYKED